MMTKAELARYFDLTRALLIPYVREKAEQGDEEAILLLKEWDQERSTWKQ